MKINQAPYFLQLDLAEDIDFAAATVLVDPSKKTIQIDMPKVVPSLWPDLLYRGDEASRDARRQAATEERQAYDAQVSDMTQYYVAWYGVTRLGHARDSVYHGVCSVPPLRQLVVMNWLLSQ